MKPTFHMPDIEEVLRAFARGSRSIHDVTFGKRVGSYIEKLNTAHKKLIIRKYEAREQI